jgi:anti-sigma factor RsiW
MLTCKDITTDAHALIDGELGLVRGLRVRFHLLICSHCQRYYRQLLMTIGILQQKDQLQAADSEPTEAEIDRLVERLKAADRD